MESNSYDAFLKSDGTIGVASYDNSRGVVRLGTNPGIALDWLRSRRPEQLVIQRESRSNLIKVARSNEWKVQPALQEAIERAVERYNQERAPLIPLQPMQRIGFLDEYEELKCSRSFMEFIQGRSYPMRVTTLTVTRPARKANLNGVLEDIEYIGDEMAVVVTNEYKQDTYFMEARFMSGVDVDGLPTPDGTFQDLVDHFVIPEVPDAASLKQEQYQKHLETLEKIMAAINS